MKQAIQKFAAVPSFRKTIATVGAAGGALLSQASFAADGDIASSATAAISSAESAGLSVGGAVVATVAALVVVSIVLAMIKKV
jgi:hypothetical protein